MISDLDETIRQILIKAGNVDPADIDISFDIPNREWSTGIAKPTINCYLFDIRENRELRQHGVETAMTNTGKTGKFVMQRPPMRFDLTYLVTAWTRAVEDEHRLLWHALQTLSRFDALPVEYLQGELRETETVISTRTALPESVLKSPGEFWTALENQLKPSLTYVITMLINRDRIPAGPPVLSTIIRYPWPGGVDQRPTWFGGVVRDHKGEPVVGARVEIEGRGAQTTTDAQGRFRLRAPGSGSYTLLAYQGERVQRLTVQIPDPSFDIDFPN